MSNTKKSSNFFKDMLYGDESGREGLRVLGRRDRPQPHLSDQPVLQGLVGPLHAAFGLACVRASMRPIR